MKLRARRLAVASGVIASLLLGILSIQFAALLTAAAAPPPAPPVPLETLRQELAAERDRSTWLQAQLDELLATTDGLTAALSATEDQVSIDGLSADQLRARLNAANDQLASVTKLLAAAQARLAAINAAASGASGSSGGGSSGGGSGTGTTPTPAPTAAPAFSLTLALSGGSVVATWTGCSVAGFAGYALVRSLDSEIHYPPEDKDTLVTTVTAQSTLSFTDSAAPAGTITYRVYCLRRQNNETQVAATTNSRQIQVP